ncbi:hydroxyphenylacetyl-CoA thioesterase PaaI [Paracoccus jiaweipingae]|uniref:hydroxyphenylacetyl-CoA thioesterase PaaI n=1 Tax=unclassified Paracoccus (in: a-proteobacteria) TaxID=2688777 RepID=UPI0037ABD4AE
MTPQALAEASTAAMWADDFASQKMGMALEQVAPGKAVLTMVVLDWMANGHGNCHGGYLFSLADSAFAFACNSYNQITVGQHASMDYLAPVSVGDRLTAVAAEQSRRGRSGIYDVHVTNQDGTLVAVFRGLSRTVKGTHLPG